MSFHCRCSAKEHIGKPSERSCCCCSTKLSILRAGLPEPSCLETIHSSQFCWTALFFLLVSRLGCWSATLLLLDSSNLEQCCAALCCWSAGLVAGQQRFLLLHSSNVQQCCSALIFSCWSASLILLVSNAFAAGQQ